MYTVLCSPLPKCPNPFTDSLSHTSSPSNLSCRHCGPMTEEGVLEVGWGGVSCSGLCSRMLTSAEDELYVRVTCNALSSLGQLRIPFWPMLLTSIYQQKSPGSVVA